MARSTLTIEQHSIDVIPAEERKGSPRNQLTLWLGANLQITAIVDGSLADERRWSPDRSYREDEALPAVRAPNEGRFCLERLAALIAPA